MRGEALESKAVGPKILIVGAQDSGKSSLCKLLCNYASRMGEQVCLIDPFYFTLYITLHFISFNCAYFVSLLLLI